MISVVIPLYNKENAIARCLDSVLMQTYADFECIVVDDGSTDNSADVVKLCTDKRMKYFYKTNGGVSSARNFGVKYSCGEYIVFLDADDVFLPNALQVLHEIVSQCKVKCGAANFFLGWQNSKKLYSFLKEGYVKNPFKQWYLKGFCPRTGCAIFARDVLEQNPFLDTLCRYEDAAMLFDIMRKYCFYYTNRPVMIYTNDNNGLSKTYSIYDKDFVFHMNFQNKQFWEKLCLTELLNQGYARYPDQCNILKECYGRKTFLRLLERLFSIYKRCLRKIERIVYV